MKSPIKMENIDNESFPEILITDTSESEDDVPMLKKRSYKSTSDVRNIGVAAPSLSSRSRSASALVGRRNSQYKDVPSKVKQYISSLPQPMIPKRLVKQQTMPEMSQLRALQVAEDNLREQLNAVLSDNQQMKVKIEDMKAQLERASNVPAAVLEPSETIHLVEPANVLRKRYIGAPVNSEVPQETNSQTLLIKHRGRGKRHKIRKIMKKLICCTGSDSLTIYDGYMEMPVTSRDYYSPTQIPY